MGRDEKGSEAHYKALFAGIESAVPSGGASPDATPADDGGASVANKIAAHAIGNGQLSARDKAAIAPAFPLTVRVTAATGPITVNYKYDLSTPDGSPRIVSFTDVTLEQGGYFVCASTPLQFTCDTLTRTGDSGTTAADFNITGKAGVKPPTPPQPGAAGQAANGSKGECSSGGIAGKGGGPGTNGAQGTPGTDGTHGSAGKPSMQATIIIQQTLTASQLTIYTESGPGGPGGDGGQGAQGQQGGNGGDGVTCGCTGNAGGQGGNGGPGGPGGRAGNGGDGVDAYANIVVMVPQPQDVTKVKPTTAPAPPGGPGTPGQGGPGGAGGGGSSGGKYNSGGSGGGTGGIGAAGGQGSAGPVTGKAAQVTAQPV
jgi:hypothetical protein